MSKLTSKEKFVMAGKLMASGLDLRKNFLSEHISDAQKFIEENKLYESEDEGMMGVIKKGDGYVRVYSDHEEEISKEAYINEVIYNYLPERFKTYKPV